MTTEQIVWTVVIVVAVLVLIGLVVASMRKKSRIDNHRRAEHLRERAHSTTDVPEATARAERAEQEAEHKRIEAQRAEQEAAEARTEAQQEAALQEDRIRAADRLDPEVDHRSRDYSPDRHDDAPGDTRRS